MKRKIGTIVIHQRKNATGGISVVLRTWNGSNTVTLTESFDTRRKAEQIRVAWTKIARTLCKYVHHYYCKNGYLPSAEVVTQDEPNAVDIAQQLALIELRPLYEGGPKIFVTLTDAGMREVQL